MKKAFILICLFAATNSIFSQENNKSNAVKKDRSFSIGTGTSISLGDLSNYYFFPKISEFGSASRTGQMLGYNVTNAYGKLGYSINFQSGGLKGFHVAEGSDTINFQGSYTTLTYNLTANSNTLLNLKKNPKLTLNGSVGIGLSTYRSYSYAQPNAVREFQSFYGYESHTSTNANGFESTELHTAAKKATLVIPIQFQLNYNLSDLSSIQFTVNRTSFFSDDIDAGSVVGFNNDRVLYLGVGLTQRFKSTPSSNKFSFGKLKSLPLYIGIEGGTFAVVGDIMQNFNGPSTISSLKLLNGKNGTSYGLNIQKYLGKRSSLTFNYNLAKASGSRTLAFADTLSQQFNLDAASLSVRYGYDLKLSKNESAKLIVTPFFGIGVTGFRSKSYFTNDNTLIDNYSYTENEEFSSFAFASKSFTQKIVIPAGVSLGLPVGNKLKLSASFSNNHYLSDALDGFVSEISRKDRSYQFNIGASFKLN